MIFLAIGCVVVLLGHAAAFVPGIRLKAIPVHPSSSVRWNNLEGNEPWFSNSVNAGVASKTKSEEDIFHKVVPKTTHQPKKLDSLENVPWYTNNIPIDTYTGVVLPHTGKIVSVKCIVGPKATGETCHVIIDHQGKMPYYEGQSYGIIPPGMNPGNGKPHNARLYSIASTRYGDDMMGQTASLCVRRTTYWDPDIGKEDHKKRGICSNYLCDAKPGDEVMLTGPTGTSLLLPESKDFHNDLIMIATGMGIAPYRSFIRRLFTERTPAAEAYSGQAWLLHGVANKDSLLYDNEWQQVKANHPKQFRLDYALSREETNSRGEKMYIHNKMEGNAYEIFNKMAFGAHIYFSGLKGMMPGILEVLKQVAKDNGLVWEKTLAEWKNNKQWHVEVY